MTKNAFPDAYPGERIRHQRAPKEIGMPQQIIDLSIPIEPYSPDETREVLGLKGRDRVEM